MKICTTFKA